MRSGWHGLVRLWRWGQRRISRVDARACVFAGTCSEYDRPGVSDAQPDGDANTDAGTCAYLNPGAYADTDTASDRNP